MSWPQRAAAAAVLSKQEIVTWEVMEETAFPVTDGKDQQYLGTNPQDS